MYQDALQLLKPLCMGSCSYRRKLKECTKSRPGIEHKMLNKNPNLQWRHLLNIPNIQSVQTNASMLNLDVVKCNNFQHDYLPFIDQEQFTLSLRNTFDSIADVNKHCTVQCTLYTPYILYTN